ncbi:hypothetical protein QQX09_10540 [Demequina sp. SYSU T00192]|uniref:Uncharacterized protein n=1 Tax=Demequina litoralis TaxID=3051660 RepID=A0ABT8GAX7_9MICO|nr:hypothetical protein [Demequina sp. SYSU T00192]MDN4476293.1 hypothetical protein [Demequina sp. SYSU T00192]
MRLRELAVAAAVTALAIIGVVPAAQADPVNGASELCPNGVDGWESKVDFTGDGPDTYLYTAPEGYVVVDTCVKAGTTTYYESFDPGVAQVTLDHPDKDSISHYAVRLEEVVPAPEPEVVTPDSPTWADPCGVDNASWTLPNDTAAYTYAKSTDGDWLIVTATAADGYTFAGGKTTMTWKDKDSGELCEEPPVDVCLNLDGVQTEVPDGYKSDGEGSCCECTPPPVVDKCLNIDGEQTTVPEGMTRDENGDCWTPKPETKVEYTEWSVSDYQCTSEKVTETRTKSTTTYTWDTATGTWVGATSETVETQKRAMTEDEAAELCPPEPHKVFVCKYVQTPDGYEIAQTGQNPISVDTHAIPGWDDSLPLEDNPKWFADAQGPSMVIAWDEEQGDGQNNEPTIDDCLMPPTVEVSDWSGTPQCGMDSYTEWATETTTGYLLVSDGEGGYSWEPYVTYKTLYRAVDVEEVVPCEDAAAAITVTPASCDAPGAVDEVTTTYATLDGVLDETVGDHLASFTADEGHAFTGGDASLVVSYSIEAQLTEGCDTDNPTPPSIDGTIVGEICTADAPYLGYDIKLTDPDGVSTDDGTATITFVHPRNAAKNWSTTVPIGTGKILWPGASVDEDGVANNWPGYKFSTAKDEWVSVGAKNYGWTRADNTEVIISVNPSKTFEVSYPPATPVCNSEPPVEIVSVLDAPAATPVTGVATYTG